MATATRQTQEQRGSDRSDGQSNRSGTQRAISNSTRRNEEGPKRQVTVAESTDAAVETIATQREHADITLSFEIKLNGFDPTKAYQV